MWECPYADCVYLVLLEGGLDLMWLPVKSFLRVCGQLLVTRAAGDGGARASTQPEVQLPLCSVAITALSGVLLEQKPWGLGQGWLFSL